MNFNFLSPDLVDSSYLSRLIENKIPENITLDYKRELHIDSSDERKEFLYDVSSFANSEGGIILYGIEEEKGENSSNSGIPGKIIGIQYNNIDNLILKMEDILGNSIQPRIPNIRIKSIEISSKPLIVIIIPKSYGLPHMVSYKSTNKFYKRRNSGKYLVDVFELNQMFMQNTELQQRANQFVSDRIAMVLNGEFIPNILTKNSSFIHIIPLSFQQNQIRLTNRVDYYTILNTFNSLVANTNHHHNFEGYILSSLTPGDNKVNSYFQVFRNGILEYYSTEYCDTMQPNNTQLFFFIDRFELDCIDMVSNAINYYKEVNVYDPFLVFINLFDLINTKIYTNSRFRISNAFGRNNLKIQPVLIKSHDSNFEQDLKPAFDVLWQSSGIEKSINYDDIGNRIPIK
jgi:hypothetical protein